MAQRTQARAEELEGLTVAQLRERLRGAGHKVSGRKAELVARLQGQAPAAGGAEACPPSPRRDQDAFCGAEDLERLTVVQLRERLRQAGLKVSGSKAELVARLQGQGQAGATATEVGAAREAARAAEDVAPARSSATRAAARETRRTPRAVEDDEGQAAAEVAHAAGGAGDGGAPAEPLAIGAPGDVGLKAGQAEGRAHAAVEDDGLSVSTASTASTVSAALGGLARLGGQLGGAISYIFMAGRNEPTFFLKWFFGDRLLELRHRSAGEAHAAFDQGGATYELCASKVETEKSFMGMPTQTVRLFYVRRDGDSLQYELEKVAAFSELREPCKAAKRLELLVSSAKPDKEFILKPEDVERIPEPQPSDDSGGCGYIPSEMLERLFPGINGRRMTEIQVRLVSPALGVCKGVLCKKDGIAKIQVPDSMVKVGPSLDSTAQNASWAWMLVTGEFPSKANLQMAKWINGKEPCKSFRQNRLSPMLQRLMTTLQVPPGVVSAYAANGLRKEAWVVGASDPTYALPAGHVFVSGLPPPLVDGRHKVFVTRSPCTLPEDGRLLPLVTAKPACMSNEVWQALSQRHFGEILFSNEGLAIPEAIAEGDLDGDLYYICWDACVLDHIKASSLADVPGRDTDKSPCFKREPLGTEWLQEARQHMLSDEAANVQRLIGKLYRAGERAAEKSPAGLGDPDARAFFAAYAQAIDSGKHGNRIDLPEHLKKVVGM